MNLFETLIRPDKEEHPERAVVARAANLLQVGEFQLLQLAWLHWHGSEMPQATSDALFSSYMLRNQVPHWARHYARRIIALDSVGMLHDGDPQYHRYDAEHGRVRKGGLRCFALAASLVIGCVFGGLYTAHLVTWHPDGPAYSATSVLPPFFTEDELKQGPRTR